MKKQATALEARHYLSNVNPAWKAFWFHNGSVVKNLKEMAEALDKIQQKVFEHHVNSGKNDIAVWAQLVIGDAELAAGIRKEKTAAGAAKSIIKRMKELEKCLAVLPAKKPAKKTVRAR